MSWTESLTKHGRIGNQRLRYTALPDGNFRLFLLEPDSHDKLELVFTGRYETLASGTACIAADYHAAQLIMAGGCPECGRELPRPTAKFCSGACYTRARNREAYRKRKQIA